MIIPDNKVTHSFATINVSSYLWDYRPTESMTLTSYWQVVVSMFDTEIRQYVKTGATGSIAFLLACKKHWRMNSVTGKVCKIQILQNVSNLHMQVTALFCIWHTLTSKEPAETADVVMRLQKTRNSEYLKYSFSAPYGTLMIFSCKNQKYKSLDRCWFQRELWFNLFKRTKFGL